MGKPKRKFVIKDEFGRPRVASRPEELLTHSLRAAEEKARENLVRAREAERRVSSAMDEGASKLLRIKHMSQLIDTIGATLSRDYGPRVMEEIVRLQQAGYPRRPPVLLSATFPLHGPRIVHLRGTIPELNYNIAVAME